MNQQDELATPDEIEFWRAKAEEVGGVLGAHFHDALDRLVRASWSSRPRVVETIDQLASLPDGTAIHNANGTLGELSTVGGVRVAFWAGNECEDELIEPWIGLPATVLYLPEEKP